SHTARRSVRRAEGATSPGRRSVKIARGHVGSSQKNRRTCRRKRNGTPCQGMSASVRTYFECTRGAARLGRKPGMPHVPRSLRPPPSSPLPPPPGGGGGVVPDRGESSPTLPWRPSSRARWTPLYHRLPQCRLLDSPKARESPSLDAYGVTAARRGRASSRTTRRLASRRRMRFRSTTCPRG